MSNWLSKIEEGIKNLGVFYKHNFNNDAGLQRLGIATNNGFLGYMLPAQLNATWSTLEFTENCFIYDYVSIDDLSTTDYDCEVIDDNQEDNLQEFELYYELYEISDED